VELSLRTLHTLVAHGWSSAFSHLPGFRVTLIRGRGKSLFLKRRNVIGHTYGTGEKNFLDGEERRMLIEKKGGDPVHIEGRIVVLQQRG